MTSTDPNQDADAVRDNTMSSTPNGTTPEGAHLPSAPAMPSSTQKELPNGPKTRDVRSAAALVESSATQTDLTNGVDVEHDPALAAPVETSSTQTDEPDHEEVHVNGAAGVSSPADPFLKPKTNGDVEPYDRATSNHVIRLSGIEHCMPRSYIRLCLAYSLPNKEMLPDVEAKLNDFVRRTVDAKPYLCGYVVAVDNPGNRVGAVEIRFSDKDYRDYPKVRVRHFEEHEIGHLTYDELCERNLPPSLIKPEIVSVLKESADEDWAPVFRIQANVIDGGIIISVYLHHCISDGTGAGLLVSGKILADENKFNRYLDGGDHDTQPLSMRLEAFADHQSHVRNELSYPSFNQINNRQLKWKNVPRPDFVDKTIKPLGRGCVFAIPLDKLKALKTRLEIHAGPEDFMTRNDVLMAFVWHSMTKARLPSIAEKSHITKSRLNIPIDIRRKLKTPLSTSYFGAAVDFASAELPLSDLACGSDASMFRTAVTIRKAIGNVDEPYIRQAIALSMKSSPHIDVRDLQGSNMDRAEGADMYITSWEKLPLYDATFEMGLGPPDWVRKPWSRDPGSCIVLPFDKRKDYLEVVIQMAVADMGRLLEDPAFMEYVTKWIE
ncbi:hypothetical protein H2200_008794 [Cladophialophora chaetospira]|uniref:Uncharacterized protein n=1 Tax=Cladophialophora chaetospira TaxID=386627 RepID=A0AA38X556_9EURO|nr:hypothetical protein H2200_008794 [Cladophialophora chaetospira]